jgi:predicted CopG family antitoxin
MKYDKRMIVKGVRLPECVLKQLMSLKKSGEKLSDVIRRALHEFIERHK